MHPLLLWLADGRLPTGGHAHSGGLEAAVASGLVSSVSSLSSWLEGRLHTAGLVDAAFAARLSGSDALVAEWSARTPVPAVRDASVAQGRGLLRIATRTWPALSFPRSLPLPLAVGVVASSAGVGAADAALAIASSSVSGPAWSATRLLGCDPIDVAAVLATLAPAVASVAADASSCLELPCPSAPLLDIGAADHAGWPTRLFAS